MIFFDVGGTLVAQRVDPATEIAATLRGMGLVAAPADLRRSLEALAHAYGAGVYAPSTAEGERTLWRALATTCLDRLPGGATPERVARLADTLEAYPAWYTPMPGMSELLQGLRIEGRALGVISNWPPSLPRLLEYHGLGPFEVLACSGALRTTKPDPGIFRWALAEAGVAAGECWYIGNDPAIDYGPSEALGLRALLWDPDGRHIASTMRRAGSAEEVWRILRDGPAY